VCRSRIPRCMAHFAEQKDSWIFTQDSLAQARQSAYDKAVKTLQRHAAQEQRTKEPPRLPSLSESLRLTLYYAHKLPELCGFCNAPPDVLWTAIVLFRRFFAVHSSIEFDPAVMMFVAVHVSCKIEEVHEITLGKLLDAADLGSAQDMKAKVSSLELNLLEGVGFKLLIEPKPDAALVMLVDELRDSVADHIPLDESAWDDVRSSAENLVVDVSVRTDAALCWPTSVVIASALHCALADKFGSGSEACSRAQTALDATLLQPLNTEQQRFSVKRMVEHVRLDMTNLSSEVESMEDMREIRRPINYCHRMFERMRADVADLREEDRQAEKRKRSGSKAASLSSRVQNEFATLSAGMV